MLLYGILKALKLYKCFFILRWFFFILKTNIVIGNSVNLLIKKASCEPLLVYLLVQSDDRFGKRDLLSTRLLARIACPICLQVEISKQHHERCRIKDRKVTHPYREVTIYHEQSNAIANNKLYLFRVSTEFQ